MLQSKPRAVTGSATRPVCPAVSSSRCKAWRRPICCAVFWHSFSRALLATTTATLCSYRIHPKLSPILLVVPSTRTGQRVAFSPPTTCGSRSLPWLSHSPRARYMQTCARGGGRPLHRHPLHRTTGGSLGLLGSRRRAVSRGFGHSDTTSQAVLTITSPASSQSLIRLLHLCPQDPLVRAKDPLPSAQRITMLM